MSTQTETIVDQRQTHQTKKPTPSKSTVGKTDLVLRSLNRKAGASVDELCKLTEWHRTALGVSCQERCAKSWALRFQSERMPMASRDTTL